MRTQLSTTILIVLTLALSATPAHAGGLVTVCDEAHLLAALAGGGTVTFACSGTITLTATVVISADTTIDGSGQVVTISGNDAVRVFTVNPDAALKMNQLTIADGNDNGGGGGGIYNNRGHLVVANSIIPDALAPVLVAGILMLALAGGAAMQHSRNWLR
jgi:hypothetical protein